MPDIVPNMLQLSSEVDEVAEFFGPALDLVISAVGADAAAVVEALPPDWSVVSVRGIGRDQVPLDVAADALETSHAVATGGWLAAALGKTVQRGVATTPRVLLARGNVAKDRLVDVAGTLSNAVDIVEQRQCSAERLERLQTILKITQDWQQTNEMETLLVRMAEAATRLFGADRASIFLWDKANKTIVGRPALGIAGGELRLPDDSGVVGQVIQTGEPRRVADRREADEIDRAVDRKTGYQTTTILCVPLVSPGGERVGAFELLNKRNGAFTSDDERGLIELASHAAVALQNTQQFSDLLDRHEKLLEQAAQDTLLVGESPPIQAIRKTIRRIADTDLAVLLLGENGTGKEVVARSIHFGSRRRKHAFIAVNCAALTETLLESELFGHEKGAFTDAHEARVGKFESASGGTLFLDEIGDMSVAGQAKLLRVLEDKIIVRVGGSKPIHTDVRVLAATNQKLAELVRAKRFREDLYFRLNVVSLELPPLRERGDDVMLLGEYFLREFSRRAGRRGLKFSAAARKRLESHTWPGNVRELRNLMERLAYLSTDDRIEAEDLAFIVSPTTSLPSLIADGLPLSDATQEFQRKYIQQSIDRARGNVSQAARNLGVHRSNLYRKMRQLGMETDDEDELQDDA
jgi:Nif-specific regulatory protein